MKHSITGAINELERAYLHFNKELFNNRLNDDILITIQTKGAKKGVLAWYAPERWENTTGTLNEINLVAEVIKKNDCYESLIHEMVHHDNNINKIKDCSRGGKYHNKAFKLAAERAGLICEKVEKYGFAFTKLGDKASASIASLNPDRTVFDFLRIEIKKKKSTSKLRKFTCGCTNIWAKVDVKADCESCGSPFIEG